MRPNHRTMVTGSQGKQRTDTVQLKVMQEKLRAGIPLSREERRAWKAMQKKEEKG